MGAESLADMVRSANEFNGLILADQAEPETISVGYRISELMEVDRLEARRVRYI
jgi:phage terminase large subunit